eukprot:15335075-Ditylum_brightwellii.AAC.3
MVAQVDDITKSVLKSATSIDNLPAYAFLLATLPEDHNSIGVFSPTASAISSFVIPFIQSIRYAVTSMPLQRKT